VSSVGRAPESVAQALLPVGLREPWHDPGPTLTGPRVRARNTSF